MILGQIFGNSFFFILGSVFPDIDHIYIIIKNKLFSWKKIRQTIKYEKDFGLRYKTPFVHSLLGLIIFSLVVYLFNSDGILYFSIAYFLHLLIDWADIDEKYYLYPLKIKFRGFLLIWSKPEQTLTIILMLLIIIMIIK